MPGADGAHSHDRARRIGDLHQPVVFPDPISDELLATDPYSERPGRDTTNGTDTIFATGGIPTVLDIIRSASDYRAVICRVIPSPSELR